MAFNIILKNSATPGQVPATYTIELGELALNTYDGKVYLKKEVDGVQTVVEVAGDALRSLSIASANGFAGSATSTTTPTITLSTTISGILKGDGTSLLAATPGTDYLTPTAGTASWALNVVGAGGASSSYAATASYAILSQNASTANIATYAIDAGNAVSSSRAISASYANVAAVALSSPSSVSSSYALNASNAATASYVLRAVSASYATIAAQATIATRANIAEIATSSLFANSATTANSASYALTAGNASTASYLLGTIRNADTASHALRAVTASYSILAINSTNADIATTAGTATSSLFANNATTAVTALRATNATNADTASYLLGTVKNASTASYVLQAVNASYATLANNALNADRANTAGTATSSLFATNANLATTALSANNATNADTASYLLGIVKNATTASYVLQAVSASYATIAAHSSNADRANTAGTATSSLFATTATTAISSSYALNSSNAVSASYVLNSQNAVSASFAFQAVNANNSISASYVERTNRASTASFAFYSDVANLAYSADSASYATTAGNTSFATRALRADTADFSVSASQANVAIYARNAANADNATSASYALTASYVEGVIGGDGTPGGVSTQIQYNDNNNTFAGVPVLTYDGIILKGTGSFSGSFAGNLTGTSSWAISSMTASSADDFVIRADTFLFTGSLNISGSTTQVGNNSLLGNTRLSGSIIISGALGTNNPTVQIYGDTEHNGYIRFDPVLTNIDTTISASYIYVSGSTQDLYFSQNGAGYNNVTRLRWLEGNLYTGLLHGGLITTQSSTVYQVASGSGIVVNLNASIGTDPYPVIQFVNWPNLSASIAPLSQSYDQTFVAILSNATIGVQGTPYENGNYNTKIPIGVVVHQNHSTINAVQTFPGVAYGWKQRSFDFIRAFGPLKISGYILAQSESSNRGLLLGGGTAWVDGRNYTIDPNNPSYIQEAVGIATSKIYRYRQSGSQWAYDTNAGAGYTDIDPTQYSLNGVLTPVPTNHWSIQRVFYFPNSGTKALYIYYGNAEYANEVEALAAVGTELFTEAPNTAANAIYIGYMLLRHNASFNTAASYVIQEAGLFRGGGSGGAGGGGGGATALSALTDVQVGSITSGQALVYNSVDAKWENKSYISASISGNAASATTASYSFTASYIDGGLY